jgi:hypothetical protein
VFVEEAVGETMLRIIFFVLIVASGTAVAVVQGPMF